MLVCSCHRGLVDHIMRGCAVDALCAVFLSQKCTSSALDSRSLAPGSQDGLFILDQVPIGRGL